jgi:hypothetical protein
LRYLRIVSILMTLLGVAALAAAVTVDVNPTVLLAGMMLVVAGIVKVVILGLWRSVAGIGAPVGPDISSNPTATKERPR